MGSRLAPVLANLFMGFHEKNWLENYTSSTVRLYKRYVDDIFCLFDHENDAMLFFEYLNSRHANIKFTFEKQCDNNLPFLDVLINNSPSACITSVFHKRTYTGLLTNFFSYVPRCYKSALIRTLVDRTFKIKDDTLKRSCFPIHFIDNVIKQYFNDFNKTKPPQNPTNMQTSYFKLPFIGQYSKFRQKNPGFM